MVVTSNPQEEDVWCIDSRAHLTLSVTKETYERLGLMGQKLPFKNHSERQGIYTYIYRPLYEILPPTHFAVVDIPLRKNVQPPAITARQKTSLGNWDKRREEQLGKGGGLWDVVYCVGGTFRPSIRPDVLFSAGFVMMPFFNFTCRSMKFLLDGTAPPHGVFQDLKVHRVQCKTRELKNVHVPIPELSPRPEPTPILSGSNCSLEDSEGLVDWDDRVQSLFEWIGMACLGAQRFNFVRVSISKFW